MSLESDLVRRSEGKCELCGATENLHIYAVPPVSAGGLDGSAFLCATCVEQLDDPEKVDVNHWRCLNESMWSVEKPVQVLAWRMLHRLKHEGWPLDLLEMLYLDEDTLRWAQATGEDTPEEERVVHKDSNGAVLNPGDSVVLIKDLVVKGGNFTAKRGTHVRNIQLDPNNETYIEGRVEGQHIVILTQYVKKSH